jgi:hypothetical protein
MQRYEYSIVLQSYGVEYGHDQDIITLNMEGDKGWELVAVTGPVQTDARGLAWLYYFKRPLVGDQQSPALQAGWQGGYPEHRE